MGAQTGITPSGGADGNTGFVIWAEEAAQLNANSFEWAFGNGDNSQANFGMVIPVDAYLTHLSLNINNGIAASVRAVRDGVAIGAVVTADIANNNGAAVFELPTPVFFPAGSNVNFQTISTTGTVGNGGKVAARFIED